MADLYTGIKMPGINSRELKEQLKDRTPYVQVENVPGINFVPVEMEKFMQDYHKKGTTFDIDVYTHVVYIEAVYQLPKP